MDNATLDSEVETPNDIQPMVADHLVDEVDRSLMSGKEAQVCCCALCQ
ncbi:MAG: hypothetical protein OSA98_12480 [Rubripirellula sp.]|nr:hypothetical protein [Rubripirellula sp.]